MCQPNPAQHQPFSGLNRDREHILPSKVEDASSIHDLRKRRIPQESDFGCWMVSMHLQHTVDSQIRWSIPIAVDFESCSFPHACREVSAKYEPLWHHTSRLEERKDLGHDSSCSNASCSMIIDKDSVHLKGRHRTQPKTGVSDVLPPRVQKSGDLKSNQPTVS